MSDRLSSQRQGVLPDARLRRSRAGINSSNVQTGLTHPFPLDLQNLRSGCSDLAESVAAPGQGTPRGMFAQSWEQQEARTTREPERGIVKRAAQKAREICFSTPHHSIKLWRT